MRPITITTGQYGDLPFEKVCEIMSGIGYEGLEIAVAAHLDVRKYVAEESYRQEVKATLDKYNLKVWAIGAHLVGQCVGDTWDPRLDNFAPNALSTHSLIKTFLSLPFNLNLTLALRPPGQSFL